MTGSARQPFPALAVNINSPGTLLHWSIFQVTVANLVLIAVMAGIFAAALLLPFPRGSRHQPAAAAGMATDDDAHDATAGTNDRADDGTAAMWTARLRRRALRMLPPGKLLPGRVEAVPRPWPPLTPSLIRAASGYTAGNIGRQQHEVNATFGHRSASPGKRPNFPDTEEVSGSIPVPPTK